MRTQGGDGLCEPGSGFSPETRSAGTFFLDFLATQSVLVGYSSPNKLRQKLFYTVNKEIQLPSGMLEERICFISCLHRTPPQSLCNIKRHVNKNVGKKCYRGVSREKLIKRYVIFSELHDDCGLFLLLKIGT